MTEPTPPQEPGPTPPQQTGPTAGRDRDEAAVTGVVVRRLALDALDRIDHGGAYANLVVTGVLERREGRALEERDRGFVTELVYGTTRMRRACAHLVERHLRGDVSARVRTALDLGAYQLAIAGVAPHAAVDATVGAAPKPARGLVNAVLRKIAGDVESGIEWPDDGTRLSYPDWILHSLRHRLGTAVADDALEAMNRPALVHVRGDGYVQDLASQRVVEAVDAGPDTTVVDLCAAPGGKATGLAATGAFVVAADRAEQRVGLIQANRTRLDQRLPLVVADAAAAPFRPGSFDRVLVDAPCTGLGVLRRRPDARWRIDGAAPDRLADVQRAMLREASRLVAPDGLLVYSVCTLTVEENAEVVEGADLGEGFSLLDTETLVPDATTDGMYIARWRTR